jgi:hypothetical protein
MCVSAIYGTCARPPDFGSSGQARRVPASRLQRVIHVIYVRNDIYALPNSWVIPARVRKSALPTCGWECGIDGPEAFASDHCPGEWTR